MCRCSTWSWVPAPPDVFAEGIDLHLIAGVPVLLVADGRLWLQRQGNASALQLLVERREEGLHPADAQTGHSLADDLLRLYGRQSDVQGGGKQGAEHVDTLVPGNTARMAMRTGGGSPGATCLEPEAYSPLRQRRSRQSAPRILDRFYSGRLYAGLDAVQISDYSLRRNRSFSGRFVVFLIALRPAPPTSVTFVRRFHRKKDGFVVPARAGMCPPAVCSSLLDAVSRGLCPFRA